MRWLKSVFASRFNRFRKENGRLFQGRFKSLLVESFDRLSRLCHYIHLNPVRAGICGLAELKDYRFGSYRYLRKRHKRPRSLNLETCLDGAGGLKDSSAGWKKYDAYLEWLLEEEPARKSLLFDKMSRGWALGIKQFKESLLKDEKQLAAAIKLGVNHAREAREIAWKVRLKAALNY